MPGPEEDVASFSKEKKKKKPVSKLLGCVCFPRKTPIGGMASIRVPEVVPSPEHDCEILRKAVQGLGTDEKAIIRVLGQRNADQIRSIRETYHQLYKESLIDRLYDELSGDFRKAVIMWTNDPAERDAQLANKALKGKKKGVKQMQVLVEIACASSPHHLVAVRKAYCSLFYCSLEEDIISDVPVLLRKVLLALVSSYRFDKEMVDESLANSDASTLHEAIQEKQLNHADFVYILSTRNVYQLRATFECYSQNFGSTIDQDVKNCGKGDLESLLKVVIECIDAPEKHFAEVIGSSIIGLGTDEDTLTRAIVLRAEIDMVQIREEYFNKYKTKLDGAVSGDTSGYYRDFLMTLLGAKI